MLIAGTMYLIPYFIFYMMYTLLHMKNYISYIWLHLYKQQIKLNQGIGADEKGLWRSFASWSCPYWTSWWWLGQHLTNVPTNQKLPKLSDTVAWLAAAYFKPGAPLVVVNSSTIDKLEPKLENLYEAGMMGLQAVVSSASGEQTANGPPGAGLLPANLVIQSAICEPTGDECLLGRYANVPYAQDPFVGGLVPNSLAVIDGRRDGGGNVTYRVGANVIGGANLRMVVNLKADAVGEEP